MVSVLLGEFPIPVPDDCRGTREGESGIRAYPARPMLITERHGEKSLVFPIPVPDDR